MIPSHSPLQICMSTVFFVPLRDTRKGPRPCKGSLGIRPTPTRSTKIRPDWGGSTDAESRPAKVSVSDKKRQQMNSVAITSRCRMSTGDWTRGCWKGEEKQKRRRERFISRTAGRLDSGSQWIRDAMFRQAKEAGISMSTMVWMLEDRDEQAHSVRC